VSARRSGIGRVLPNRRAFLRGAAGAAVALPFLESIPERSPWAADGARPVFAFFICSVGGVVRAQFFPSATGPLTQTGLAAAGKATSQLAAHADNLLFVSGLNWLPGTSQGDAHVNSLCTALTATVPVGTADVRTVTAGGPSADAFIAAKVHPEKSPLALYAGFLRNGYAAQRLSFAGPGQLNPVVDNPYDLYRELMGLATPGGDQTAQRLLQSRKSVHDLVRDELTSLMQHPRLGAADRQRLQQHFEAIRDAETTMGALCSPAGLDVTALGALQTFRYDARRTDEMVRLHMSLVAMAFACNQRRAASLQWGDPYDFTIYDVPSNARQWKFAHVSHRMQSDSAVGSDASDPLAAQAHAEIDAARMKTLADGLESFKARGLADRCIVMWTINYAEGPSHTTVNVPHIIWGNGGGFLKQGQYVDAGGATNNRLLNTVISAALQDTHTTVENFGEGPGGMLDVARARATP
jgi:hypothetical protein